MEKIQKIKKKLNFRKLKNANKLNKNEENWREKIQN